MRSPTEARRLLDAMERLESGRGEARDVIDTADVLLVRDENAYG